MTLLFFYPLVPQSRKVFNLHFIFVSFYFSPRITELQNDLMDYNILDNAIFIPISAKIGTNLDLLKNSIIDAVQIYREAEKKLSVETEKKKIEQEAETKRKIQNMAVENRGVTKGEGEGDAGEKEAEDFGSIDGIEYTGSSSNGVLLDIIKSRKLGTTLHVVIKEGQVCSYVRVLFTCRQIVFFTLKKN